MITGDPDATNRRQFFKQFLKKTVLPVADFVEDRLEVLAPQSKPLLRPPGAIPELSFLETCQRCGHCAAACPADAIRPIRGGDESLRGTPWIDPDRQPCVVCDGLECMQVCPSGALQRLMLDDIKIGLAVVDEETCVRTEGEDCRLCVTSCPLGERAIRLDGDGAVFVIASGCIGCGVCQHACPTQPRAIRVMLE